MLEPPCADRSAKAALTSPLLTCSRKRACSRDLEPLTCGAVPSRCLTPSAGTMCQMPVVVGYNGKKHASEALDWAADEALHSAAALVVLFAANYPGMTLPQGPDFSNSNPVRWTRRQRSLISESPR